ncbi:hypothetical protein AAVH_21065 [Aphelenchoides avenae]|nr:hypothetical protein AAVH_21065 [Aphelenchus avenae]
MLQALIYRIILQNDSFIERALSELFFCRKIVALAHRPTPSYNWQGVCRMRDFFTLPCVRSCSKLNLLKDVDVRGLSYDDVRTWLNSGNKHEVKELQCFSKFFDGEFSAFLERLKQSFEASSAPCRFKLTVFEDVHYPEEAYDSRATINRRTGETLKISVVEPRTYDKPHIAVERLVQ